jgi:hypothetical protein
MIMVFSACIGILLWSIHISLLNDSNLVYAIPSLDSSKEESVSPSGDFPTFSNNRTEPIDIIEDSSIENITCYVDISDSTGLIEVGFSYRFTTTDWADWGIWSGSLPAGKYTFKATVPRSVWINYVGQRLYHRWYAINKLGNRGDSPEYTGPAIVDDDVNPPLISNLYAEDQDGDITIEATERFRFLANVTDPSGVYTVEVHYDTDGELATDYSMLSMYQINEGQYASEYMDPLDGCEVTWRIYAVDNDTDRIDDRSAGYSDIQTLIVYEVIIDGWFVTDYRCDVGSVQTVGFHARWAHNGSDISLGTIYINGTGYVTNETGWANFDIAYDTVGERLWTVTSVSCYGITAYEQVVDNPAIIWDRIRIISGGVSDSRCDVETSQTIWFTAEYEYDGTMFTDVHGVLYINNTACTWDSVNMRWYITYSSSIVAKYDFRVTSILDRAYGLSSINDLVGIQTIIWDRVKIIEGGVSAELCNVGTTQMVWVKAIYDYDDSTFDASKGMVYMNSTPMSWSSTMNRWEHYFTAEQIGTLTFVVTSITDDVYGLTVMEDTSGLKTITWTALKVVSVKVDKTVTNTDSAIYVYVRIFWAHNNSAISSGTVGLNGTLFTSVTNNTGWAVFELSYSNVTADVVFEVLALSDAEGCVTLCLQPMYTPKLTWTELWVEELRWDKDFLYEGENIVFSVKLVWAHNGSAVVGGVASINRTYFGITNSSGWALITIRLDVCGVYNFTAYAERDSTGLVTKCTKTLFHSLTVRIVGDLNGDGKVDILDIATVAKAFGSFPGDSRWNPIADVNRDGKVDILDIAMVATNFGKTAQYS